MGLFCEHKWELISNTTLPSAFQIAVEKGGACLPELLGTEHVADFLRSVNVQVFGCEKCGALRTERTFTIR